MADYRFSNIWFEGTSYGRRGTLVKESTKQVFERLLIPEAKAGGCRRILEVGLSEGRSAIWFLENLKPELWVGIDAWQWGRFKDKPMYQRIEANFWHNMTLLCNARDQRIADDRTWKYGETTCRVQRGMSQQVMLEPDAEYVGTSETEIFDCIYLDGDHTGHGTILDAVLCWRKLAVGGIMIFDDYDRRWHNARPCTHEAVNAFWATHEHFCEKVFESRFQFWIRKKANA